MLTRVRIVAATLAFSAESNSDINFLEQFQFDIWLAFLFPRELLNDGKKSWFQFLKIIFYQRFTHL